ncbi:MAG: hypothetical protein HRT87_08175 [Legionellales bacterium]|nr:hypothetical protein [Legionellales bacterium]
MRSILVLLTFIFSSNLFALYPFQTPYLNQDNIDKLRIAVESNHKTATLTMDDNKEWVANVLSEINSNIIISKHLTLLPRNYIGHVNYVVFALDKNGYFKKSKTVIQWTAHFIASKSTVNKKGTYYLIPLIVNKDSKNEYTTKTGKIYVVEITKPRV